MAVFGWKDLRHIANTSINCRPKHILVLPDGDGLPLFRFNTTANPSSLGIWHWESKEGTERNGPLTSSPTANRSLPPLLKGFWDRTSFSGCPGPIWMVRTTSWGIGWLPRPPILPWSQRRQWCHFGGPRALDYQFSGPGLWLGAEERKAPGGSLVKSWDRLSDPPPPGSLWTRKKSPGPAFLSSPPMVRSNFTSNAFLSQM